jgi:hypothetical protein|tara:strand:+ start:115 stop:354 length:240 start_codon:yes stop_codon:yes gene_type:complete
MCKNDHMSVKKTTDWEELLDTEVFATGLVDPSDLNTEELSAFIESIYQDYTFYKNQKYDTYIIELYEQVLSHVIKTYGH